MQGPTRYEYQPQDRGHYPGYGHQRGCGRIENLRARGRENSCGNGRGGSQPEQEYRPPQDSAQFVQYSDATQPTQLGRMSES